MSAAFADLYRQKFEELAEIDYASLFEEGHTIEDFLTWVDPHELVKVYGPNDAPAITKKNYVALVNVNTNERPNYVIAWFTRYGFSLIDSNNEAFYLVKGRNVIAPARIQWPQIPPNDSNNIPRVLAQLFALQLLPYERA